MYKTIAEVKKANKSIGHHWFEASTMSFFNSVIETDLLHGRFFITSERMELDMPKQYSIRCAQEDGSISTIGKRGEFNNLTSAMVYLDKWLE